MKMRDSIDRQLHNHVRGMDEVFNSLGFCGDDEPLDQLRFAISGADFLCEIEVYDQQVQATELVSAIHEGAKVLLSRGHPEDQVASYMLGRVVGQAVFSLRSTLSDEQKHGLIDRSLQNIQLAHRLFERGSAGLFMNGLTCEAEQDNQYAKTKRTTRQFVRGARKIVRNQHVDRTPRQAERPSLRPDFIKAMAYIGMMSGYYIQIPDDQTDEKGTWQPDHGTANEDEY